MYELADELLRSRTGTRLSLSFLLCAAPIKRSDLQILVSVRNVEVFDRYFDACIDIFLNALRSPSTSIYRWLMNDAPASLRRRFHLDLPRSVFARPLFFRTDESQCGRVIEIQCPGSGWGDLQLLTDTYKAVGIVPSSDGRDDPADKFVRQAIAATGQSSPALLHLLDNASAPASIKYHIATTAPPLRYWGYSDGVDNARCELIRSHSFYGLVAENRFGRRLQQAASGTTQFDLPPIVLFDQKACMALPFWEPTRDLFSDEVRKRFAYTYPLSRGGFKTEDGERVALDDVLRLPRAARRYFVKYAGVDVGLNWGSQAVWRMSDNGFDRVFPKIASSIRSGRPWIIQSDFSDREHCAYAPREDPQSVISRTMFVKYSNFFGPTQLIGTKVMYSDAPKVHGQSDTIVGLA